MSAVERIVQELKDVRNQLREKDHHYAVEIEQIHRQHNSAMDAAQAEKRSAGAKQMRIHTIAMDIALKEKEVVVSSQLGVEFAARLAENEVMHAAALETQTLEARAEMTELVIAKEREQTAALDSIREQYEDALRNMQQQYLASLAEKDVQHEVRIIHGVHAYAHAMEKVVCGEWQDSHTLRVIDMLILLFTALYAPSYGTIYTLIRHDTHTQTGSVAAVFPPGLRDRKSYEGDRGGLRPHDRRPASKQKRCAFRPAS
jgi:hypothetical protein